MIYTIYKATNTINNKSYVGYTSDFESRLYRHQWHSKNSPKQHFHKAINKYGWDNFDWSIVYQSTDKDHTLFEMEEFFIREYKSHALDGYGYNYSYGGNGAGQVRTKSHIDNLNRSKKDNGFYETDTWKTICANRKGTKQSQEHKDRKAKAKSRRVVIDGITYSSGVEAAKALNKSKSWVSSQIKQGKAIKLG